MLLGAPSPCSPRATGGEWRRKVEPTRRRPRPSPTWPTTRSRSSPRDDVALFTSGERHAGASPTGARRAQPPLQRAKTCAASPSSPGARCAHAEREAAGVRVRSVYAPEHETDGPARARRGGRGGAHLHGALRAAPLQARDGRRSAARRGIRAARSSPASPSSPAPSTSISTRPPCARCPRSCASSGRRVEDSLEFAAAHMVAHQWWGGAVGSDPAREPVLDEALAHWSALLYYRDARGAERARAARGRSTARRLPGLPHLRRRGHGRPTAPRATTATRSSTRPSSPRKGALMFDALRGTARRASASSRRCAATTRRTASRSPRLDDLRAAFAGGTERRSAAWSRALFERWLSERHGDEDIAPPNPQLAAALGVTVEQRRPPADRNAFSRLGRFFWRQMTRIR